MCPRPSAGGDLLRPLGPLRFQLALTPEVDGLAEDAGHLLRGMKAHGVFRRHEVEPPTSGPSPPRASLELVRAGDPENLAV